MAQLGGMDEFGLIAHLTARYRAKLADRLGTTAAFVQPTVRVDIGDDAAVLEVKPGEDQLLTTDTMVHGVHFLPATMDWPDVGYKAVAASVSDIAAMGGVPRYAVLAIAIPADFDITALEFLYDGIADVCADTGCRLVGGDVVGTSGPLVITSTVLGGVPVGEAVRRGGAAVGDVVFVTGTVGDSSAGLAMQQQVPLPRVPADEGWALRQAHSRPRPQVEAGLIARACGASALNDITDGLASELNEIARASTVRLRIDAVRIPVSPAVQNFARARMQDPLEFAWYGGEDYQLVGTASPFAYARMLARCESIGVRITQIGRVEAGDGEVVASLENGSIDLIEPRGYNHFKEPDVNRS